MEFSEIARRAIESNVSLSSLSQKLGKHSSYISKMKERGAIANPMMSRRALRWIGELERTPSSFSVLAKSGHTVTRRKVGNLMGVADSRICVFMSPKVWECSRASLLALDPGLVAYSVVSEAQ